MSNPFLPPTLPTAEQLKAARLAALIIRINSDGAKQLQSLINFVKTGWDNVWENSQFTPAEVLAAMGTNAVEIFRTSALVTAAIYGVDPSLLDIKYLSAKQAYTANADGTITLA
jgi:hypothetical protein